MTTPLARRGLTRRAILAGAGFLSLLAATACRPHRASAVRLPLNPPWWQAAVPLTHQPLSAVLAGGFPLPGEDLDPRRTQFLRNYLATLADGGPESTPELSPTRRMSSPTISTLMRPGRTSWGRTPSCKKLRLTRLRAVRVRLDRRLTTLDEIAAHAREQAVGEPRIELFLNPGWRGGPRLPPSAVEGYSLSWQLAEQARRWGAAPGTWAVDALDRQLGVSEMIAELPSLPAEPHQRCRRALDLVPPPEPQRARILATCGELLQRCEVRWVPMDRRRV